MTITAHKNYIFVKPIDQGTSKIIVPPVFKKGIENVQRGQVKACGPQSFVNPGEIILFDKWTDNAIEINGERLIVIQPHSLITVEA